MTRPERLFIAAATVLGAVLTVTVGWLLADDDGLDGADLLPCDPRLREVA